MIQRLYYGIIWMFISPVVALSVALRSSDRRYKRWMLILFTTIFGSIIILGSADGIRHWQNVYDHYVGLGFVQFLSEIGDILFFRVNPDINQDLYIHVISYLTGEVLALPGLFYVVVAFVYGYFFAGSMFRLFEVFPKLKRHMLFFGLAVIFVLWLNITAMNTVRTWTGFWILFYACISYYQTGCNKYLWLMFVPPFIHFGFFIMAIPAWIVAWAGNRKMIYAVLFAVSFGATLISPQVAVQQLERTELGEAKVQSYQLEQETTIEETLEGYGGRRIYVQYMKIGTPHWAVVLIAFTFIIFGTYFRSMNKLESSLFSIGILTKVLSNSMWYIFAISNRSATISSLFILAALLIFWQRYYFSDESLPLTKLQRGLLGIALIMLLPLIVYQMANIMQFANVFILFFPFLPWFDSELHISIREFIGYLL